MQKIGRKMEMAHRTHNDRRMFGIGLVLAATVLWSTAGLFVRMVDLDVWKILGWRSVFAAIALAIIVATERRRQDIPPDFTLKMASLLTVPIAIISMGAYVVSLKLTTVANVMVVYATVPLVAAGLAWLALREKPPGTALVASLVAFAGVFLMVGGAVQASDVQGIFVAFMMTLAMGAQIVLARKYPGMGMANVNMLAATACAIAGLTMAQPGLPSAQELLVLMLFGVTNTALAYYFVLLGARYIPSAEVGLISTLDVVLGPLWVWLLFAENPGIYALAGGMIVLAAVLGYLVANLKSPQQASFKK
jgi:drug/metabolite transporter (DMT)-like permease